MAKKKMWVEWDDGASLSQSHKKPGSSSPLTRDADGNLGQVTLSEIDESDADCTVTPDWDWGTTPDDGQSTVDQDESDSEAAELVLAALILGVAMATPHVRAWWATSALPAIQGKRTQIADAWRRRKRHQTEVSLSTQDVPQATPSDVAARDEDPVIGMSPDEAKARFLAAALAKAFSDEQIRLIMNAKIESSGPGFGSYQELAEPSSHEIENLVRLMLESHPSETENLYRMVSGEYTGEPAEHVSAGDRKRVVQRRLRLPRASAVVGR